MAHEESGKITLDLSVWTAALVACGVAVVAIAFELGAGSVHASPARVGTAQVEAAEHPLRLTILHTNDLHGQVLPQGKRGGLVALGRRIRQARDEARLAGDAVLLLDAGDLFKGTPEGDFTNGQVVVAWMNRLGYDAAAVGNHEFDHGIEVVQELARAAEFPFLAANLREEASGERPDWLGRQTPLGPLRGAAVLRTVYDARGRAIRVGIVGTTPGDLAQVTLAGLTEGLRAEDEVAALEPVLAALPADLDLVVVVSHSGIARDTRVAERFGSRVHVIVGGHNHKTLPEGQRVGAVLMTQTGAHAAHLGRVRVELPAGEAPRATASLVEPGDDFEALLAPYVAEVQRTFAERVGELREPLRRVTGFASSGLGNLETDLMRELTGAEVALQNKAGIRNDLPAGELSKRDVYEVAPFGNTVVSMQLSGAQLREVLEVSLTSEGRMCDVSGLLLRCDPRRPVGQRVLEVTVGGKPLDDSRTYRVATNNFLAGGGDGKVAFTQGSEREDTQRLLRELLEDYLRVNSPVAPPPVEARIVTVD